MATVSASIRTGMQRPAVMSDSFTRATARQKWHINLDPTVWHPCDRITRLHLLVLCGPDIDLLCHQRASSKLVERLRPLT